MVHVNEFNKREINIEKKMTIFTSPVSLHISVCVTLQANKCQIISTTHLLLFSVRVLQMSVQVTCRVQSECFLYY